MWPGRLGHVWCAEGLTHGTPRLPWTPPTARSSERAEHSRRIGVELSEEFQLHPEQSTRTRSWSTTPRPSTSIRERAEAVLFDLDGTLIDSEPYWIKAEYKLVAEFGGQWSDEHAHTLIGSDLLVAAAYIRDVGGVALEPAEIVDRMLEHVIGATRQQVPWQPGARELIANCRAAGLPSRLSPCRTRR